MRFIKMAVEITDHAIGATWDIRRTYHYQNKEFGETNLPDLERRFAKEAMQSFVHHIGFFGRTVTVSPLVSSYESRQPTLEEMKALKGWEPLRMVEKVEAVELAEPIQFPGRSSEGTG